MDNIATHANKLLKPYVRSPKAQAVVASAKKLAEIVLREPALLPLHRDKVLSLLQWFVSEVDGKHTTRFRSKRVVDLAMNDPASLVKINHEHVYTRKEMAQRLVAEPDRIGELLDEVIGCIVTKEEHDSMPQNATGWERYRRAGVVVLDMSTWPPTIHDAG